MLLLLLVPLSWSQSLPDAPSSTRVADKNFWSLTAADGAITPDEIGSPGLYGEKAPPACVAAVMGGTYAASVVTSYFLKKYNVHI